MGEQMPNELDNLLRRVLRHDFSAGTEEFRDALLVRCLEELRATSDDADLSDGDLGLLAAAGDAQPDMREFRPCTILVD